MDDVFALQKTQTTQHLLSEPANQTQREAFEFVSLDKLVQIHAEKLSGDAEMTSEIKALCEREHIVLSIRILAMLVEITEWQQL